MNTSERAKGISRIDSGSTHGWFVRGYKNGKVFSKLFSDGRLSGRDNALTLAKTYRDKLHLELAKIPPAPRVRRLALRDSRNRTGVLGVCRTRKKGPNGVISEVYTVTWRPEPGVQKCTSFSIKKYGEKGAFRLAVAHRRAMLRTIYGPGIFRKIAAMNEGRAA